MLEDNLMEIEPLNEIDQIVIVVDEYYFLDSLNLKVNWKSKSNKKA